MYNICICVCKKVSIVIIASALAFCSCGYFGFVRLCRLTASIIRTLCTEFVKLVPRLQLQQRRNRYARDNAHRIVAIASALALKKRVNYDPHTKTQNNL